MECEPALRALADVVSLATLAETAAVPICTLPSRNVTVPEGAPPNDGMTEAVKVTDCP
jgi:hypothetical protein